MPHTAQPGRNLPSLTSLRFFAAALVAYFHASVWVHQGGAPTGVALFGFVGVTFFFVLSGFVLTWTWKPHEPARRFYLRRFARIYPLHLATALAAMLLGITGVVAVNDSSGAIVTNLLLVQSWTRYVYGLNDSSWSLSVEAFFYAVFPLLVVRLARLDSPRGVAAITVVWLGFVGGVADHLSPTADGWLYSIPAYRIGEFVVGSALALSLRRGPSMRRLPVWTAGLLAAACYLALGPIDWASGHSLTAGQWKANLLMLPAFALLIVTAAQRDLAGETGWLHHPWLIKLGQWSFALYLIHDLALRAFMPLLTGPWAWPLAILVLVLAQALAAAAYEWYERPVERYIRSLGHQKESTIATTTPATSSNPTPTPVPAPATERVRAD